jgi:hypothetical protein
MRRDVRYVIEVQNDWCVDLIGEGSMTDRIGEKHDVVVLGLELAKATLYERKVITVEADRKI